MSPRLTSIHLSHLSGLGYRGVEETHVISLTHAPSTVVEKIGSSWIIKSDALWIGVIRSADAAVPVQKHVDVLISSEPLRHMRMLCSRPYLLIDRFDGWRDGGMMLFFDNGRLWTENVREDVGDRPWALKRKAYANKASRNPQK